MRHLKTYRVFESAAPGLTQEQEEFLNKYTKGSWKYDPTSGLVDVEGDFDISSKSLVNMNGIKFGKVSGEFACSSNNLTSLEGAPREVGETFYCHNNNLTTLEGAPQKVGGTFDCGDNKLTTLEGAPLEVGRSFLCGAFRLEKGQWNPKGWLSVLKEGNTEAQKLISTLLSPELLNKEIQKDPAGMIMKLKEIWNDEWFKETRDQLVWPKGYEQEADLLGDLDDVGF